MLGHCNLEWRMENGEWRIYSVQFTVYSIQLFFVNAESLY